MAMVQSAPFGDLTGLPDLDHNLLSPLSLHLSNPEPERTAEPEPNTRPAKRRQSSASDRGKGGDGSKDQPRMLACLNCRQKKIKVDGGFIAETSNKADADIVLSREHFM